MARFSPGLCGIGIAPDGLFSPGLIDAPAAPAAITADTSPLLAALADGDTLSSAVTWGAYTSSEGAITGTVREMSVNGGSFVAYDGTTVVAYDDTYALRETVSDDAGNSRAFLTGTQTVAGLAPTADTAPSIGGTVAPGETVTITEGTYSGPPAPTVTGTLTLDGVDVTGDMSGLDYTIPAGTDGQDLVWSEVASNGIAPDATQSVTETVSAVTAIDPASTIQSGDMAVLLDFGDWATAYQDVQGTSTAVSADGDPIGTLIDQGTGFNGTLNDIYAPDSASRLTAVDDGTHRYATFPGALGDERMGRAGAYSGTVSGLTDFDDATYVIAVQLTGGGGRTGTFRDSNFDDQIRLNLDSTPFIYSSSAGGEGSAQMAGWTFDTNWHVFSFRKNGSECEFRVDGQIINTVTGLGAFDVDMAFIELFGEGGSGVSMCFLIDRALPASDLAGVEQYAAEHSPASIA